MNADSERHNVMEEDDLSDSPPATPMQGSSTSTLQNGQEKKPIIRGARACTTCRNAKMRCIGGDDQAPHIQPCNRCKKSGVECVYEKHRRGRKPGSKLSEMSKARRQQGQSAVQRPSSESNVVSPLSPNYPRTAYSPITKREEQTEPMDIEDRPALDRSAARDGPILAGPPQFSAPGPFPPPSHPSLPLRSRPGSVEDDDRSDENLFPSAMLAREKSRQSFLATVLGPTPNPSTGNVPTNAPRPPNQTTRAINTREGDNDWERMLPPCFALQEGRLPDPIEVGFLTEADCTELLAKIFEHLNPFVNLFDPELHTVQYIRNRSTFLFTALMMAGCKFFRPGLFKPLQRMAYTMAWRVFDSQDKSVETVQAFCCLIYWKEPDDNRTWLFVGYACRMAIELGLNHYTRSGNVPGENDQGKRERRNRERTYLVLFVHDRSLSMQTGRPWMLQEDDLVRNADNWHRQGFGLCPEDVIVAAFVALRRLSAETSDVFYLRRNSRGENSDVNCEVLLNGCNTKLTAWMEYWEQQMTTAEGNEFHFCLLRFFRLHVRLFLNSLGLTRNHSSASAPGGSSAFSIQALSLCYTSAKETLQIVAQFRDLGTLMYGQDVITVMSAYAAIFLLRLVRRTGNDVQHGLNAPDIRALISQTAGAFYDGVVRGATGAQATAAAAHARFLYNLVTTDEEDEARRMRAEAEAEARANASNNAVGPVAVASTDVRRPLEHPQPPSASGPSTSRQTVSANMGAPFSPGHPLQSPASGPGSATRSPHQGYAQASGRPDLTIATSAIHPPMLASAPSYPSSETVYQSLAHQSPNPPYPGPGQPISASSSSATIIDSRMPGPSATSGMYPNGDRHGNGDDSSNANGNMYPQQRSPVYHRRPRQDVTILYPPEPGTIPVTGLDPQTQMLLQTYPGDPRIESQYTQNLYEQLGMQGAHLRESPAYTAPAQHPYLPTMEDQGMYHQFGGT